MAKRSTCSTENLLRKALRTAFSAEEYQADREGIEVKLRERQALALADSPIGGETRRLALEGGQRVHSGDIGGWQAIQSSLQYKLWSNYIQSRRADRMRPKPETREISKGQFSHGEFWDVAYGLTYAVACSWHRPANVFGQRLLKSMEKRDGLVMLDGWQSAQHFPVFALWLYARWRNLEIQPGVHPAADLGRYANVFTSWQNDTDFAQALEAACELHVKEASRNFGCFEVFPQSVVPAEIVAAQRVRVAEGFAPVEINHPLMQSPFADLPAAPFPDREPLLDRIIARCREQEPDLEDIFASTVFFDVYWGPRPLRSE